MRKTKEISRLADAGLTGRAIARSLGSSSSTVADAIACLKAAGLSWEQVQAMSEAELERRLYREAGHAASDPREPDWGHVCSELKRRHMTLQLLWCEYRGEHPDGYAYSWFCERYKIWLGRVDPVMRQNHIFGEKLFVDWVSGFDRNTQHAEERQPYA